VITSSSKLALLMEGYVRERNGKMGFGLLRYGARVAGCEVTCVVAPDEVGQDLRVLTGIDTDVPIVGSVEEARAMGADTLVLAVATSGGVLPENFRAHTIRALRSGMSLVNGLHGRYADIPEFAEALQPGATIWDVRLEPSGLRSGRGLAKDLPCRRVLTVGTDMAIGKMTASLELDLEARARGIRSKFLATGQIGICISGDGVPLDAVRVDFASGSIEMLCEKYGHDHDVLWVEGQGSALHPGSTAWISLLRGSMATDMILVHRFGQTVLGNGLDSFPIPPLPDVIRLYETAAAAGPGMPAAKVRAIALNCAGLTDAEVVAAVAETEALTRLPSDDVVRNGASKLLNALPL
jgi:uncharacterized NAD-dependent epimerase/dehydratase family protein